TTVARLRDDIDGAARAITSGEQAVRDVGAIATEATAAVGHVLAGVERLRRVTEETAAAARSHGSAVRQVSAATTAALRSLDGTSVHIRDIVLAAQRQHGVIGEMQTVVSDGPTRPTGHGTVARPSRDGESGHRRSLAVGRKSAQRVVVR